MASWKVDSYQHLARQANGLAQSVHSIGYEFRSSFNTEVDKMVNNVRQLESLSETDFERIRLSLYDAARACVSTGWWSIFWGIVKKVVGKSTDAIPAAGRIRHCIYYLYFARAYVDAF